MSRQWIKSTIFALLLINLAAFYFLRIYVSPIENSFLFRFLSIILIIWVWWAAYREDQYEQLIVVTFFLTVFNLDKLYLGISVPIAFILILAAALACGLFYASIRLNMAHANRLTSLYCLIVGLISAESFLAASIWSPNNATLSSIVSVCFYFSWHVILQHLNHRLNKKAAFQYAFYCFVALFLIIVSTSWYNS